MTFDVLIHWYTGYEKARLTSHSKWYRNMNADSLIEACQKALANHADQISPAVSMCWPTYKPKEELCK